MPENTNSFDLPDVGNTGNIKQLPKKEEEAAVEESPAEEPVVAEAEEASPVIEASIPVMEDSAPAMEDVLPSLEAMEEIPPSAEEQLLVNEIT